MRNPKYESPFAIILNQFKFKQRMRSLEIFSGAGGLAKGLELAGFEHSAFVEFNKDACASLWENFGKSKVFFGDVRDFDLSQVGKVEMVAGGPPCQPFSLGGKHGADKDDRDMFPYAIKAIEKLSPKAFIFENVKGLLRQSFSEYFEYILLRLTYPGIPISNSQSWKDHLHCLKFVSKKSYIGTKYNVHYKLINAANYGVPQCRERVVIVGIRSDLNINYSFPKETHSEDRLLWDMFISNKYWKKHKLSDFNNQGQSEKLIKKINNLKRRYSLFEPNLKPWRTIRDALYDIPSPEEKHNIPDHIFRKGAKTYAGHTGSEIDWPAKTIKAGGHGVPGGENMIRYPDGRVRYFTVFEAKRIQTFPDDYIITGSWGEAMRQIGNAVPVQLGKVIGDSIATILKEDGCKTKSKIAINSAF